MRRFYESKDRVKGLVLLSDPQREWVRMYKQAASAGESTLVPPPAGFKFKRSPVQFFTSRRYGYFICFLIVCNEVLKALEGHVMPGEGIAIASRCIEGTYIVEAVLKIFAISPLQYIFNSRWNQLDLLICFFVVCSYVDSLSSLAPLTSLKLLFILRYEKGLSELVDILVVSAASLINMFAVVCLILYITGCAAMSLFGEGATRGMHVNSHTNFEDFPSSVLSLLRISTGESWTAMYRELTYLQPSNEAFILPFFVLFVVFIQFCIISLFVAVVISNFEVEEELSIVGTSVDVDSLREFSRIWRKYADKFHAERTGRNLKYRLRSSWSYVQWIFRGYFQKYNPLWLPFHSVPFILEDLAPPLGMPRSENSTVDGRAFRFVDGLKICVDPLTGMCNYHNVLFALLDRAYAAHKFPKSVHNLLDSQMEKRRAFRTARKMVEPEHSISAHIAAHWIQLLVRKRQLIKIKRILNRGTSKETFFSWLRAIKGAACCQCAYAMAVCCYDKVSDAP